MMETVRIRLEFEDKEGILSKSQKSEGLERCWLLLKPQLHKTIADITAYILYTFQLHPSCPHGLLLYMDGFVLPTFESTAILKDKDVISVRKKGVTLSLGGNNAINLVAELEAVEKQPLNTGALLLANEEFEKETGGYQSDEPEDESEEEDGKEDEAINASEEEEEEELLEETLNNSLQKNETLKKRKAPEKLQGSKKKRRQSEAQVSIENAVPAEHIENSCQDGVLATKESAHNQEKVSELKKKNNNYNAELGGGNIAISSNLTSDQTQKNGKEIEEAAGGTQKLPSRSARRKKAKRRWIREMATIQKKDSISEPKELQNWKKKPTRAEVNKYDSWKQKPAKSDAKENDGQPKGLLYWKQWSGKGTSNDKKKHQEVNQNGRVSEQSNQNGTVSEQSNQKKDTDDEVVPVVIRPGHIRFESPEKVTEETVIWSSNTCNADQTVTKNKVSEGPFQWNGITSKKKGQKWGTDKYSLSQRNNYRDIHSEHPVTSSIPKEMHLSGHIDFDKLTPLSDFPKVGDVIAYRLLELSSNWTPELSFFRVGRVSWCCSKSVKLILMPVPGYPIISKNSDEDEPDQQAENSLYKEDGSLEIDFSTLVDVRVVNDGNEGPPEVTTAEVNGGLAATENATLSVPSSNNDKESHAPNPGTGEGNSGKQANASGIENGGNIWQQLSEALNAKKDELSKRNTCDKASSGKSSWSYRALKGSALGPTMAFLRSNNKL
ncbi:hypothetical protein ACH5RR_035560 [Cinchona calisaya]|uniref:Coilin n=1 Tax=Cinchona calisaya TaxID=153742 RepID=A0ABD2Y0K1_9GENT